MNLLEEYRALTLAALVETDSGRLCEIKQRLYELEQMKPRVTLVKSGACCVEHNK